MAGKVTYRVSNRTIHRQPDKELTRFTPESVNKAPRWHSASMGKPPTARMSCREFSVQKMGLWRKFEVDFTLYE